MSKALSIRQPWAAMIALGVKSIEIRRWQCAPSYRGELYIHASRTRDGQGKSEWELINRQVYRLAQWKGGIVGRAKLVDVIRYASKKQWDADFQKHKNDKEWFEEGLIGLVFEDAEVVRFMPCRGQLEFFEVAL